jgi:hypothetical protein
VSAEQAVDIGIEANEALQVHLPDREKELVAGRQAAANREQMAQRIRAHPKLTWVNNAEDPLGQRAQMFMKSDEVRNHRMGPMLGVMLALGEKALNEMVKAPVKLGQANRSPVTGAAGRRSATPLPRKGLPPGGGSAGARQPSSKTEIAKAMEKVSKTHSKQSFADFLDKAVPRGMKPSAARVR